MGKHAGRGLRQYLIGQSSCPNKASLQASVDDTMYTLAGAEHLGPSIQSRISPTTLAKSIS